MENRAHGEYGILSSWVAFQTNFVTGVTTDLFQLANLFQGNLYASKIVPVF